MYCKHWSVTINNPQVTGEFLHETLSENPQISNYSLQLEKGKETETQHLQIYLGFRTKVRRGKVTALLGTDAFHAECCRDPRACYLYCQKEDTRISGPWASEWEGTRQGERTDLQRAAQLIKDSGIRAVADELPEVVIKFPRGLRELDSLLHEDSNEIRLKEVVFLWGPTGTGKTTQAMSYPGARMCEVSNGFFDYESCETCVFDEVDEILGSVLPIQKLLKLCDRWPTRVPIKGGWKTFNPPRIVMTSNIPPEVLFGGQHYEAICRRLTTVSKVVHGPEVAGNRNGHPSE